MGTPEWADSPANMDLRPKQPAIISLGQFRICGPASRELGLAAVGPIHLGGTHLDVWLMALDRGAGGLWSGKERADGRVWPKPDRRGEQSARQIFGPAHAFGRAPRLNSATIFGRGTRFTGGDTHRDRGEGTNTQAVARGRAGIGVRAGAARRRKPCPEPVSS